MSSGKKSKYQLSKHDFRKLKTLTEPGLEIQIDFLGKLNNKKLDSVNDQPPNFANYRKPRKYQTS